MPSFALFLLVAAPCLVTFTDGFQFMAHASTQRRFAGLADNEEFDALTYLEQAGYLDDLDSTRYRFHAPDSVKKALREFQQYAKVPVTGRLDAATVNMMRQPRCGNPDVIKPSERLDENAPENYKITPYEWPKNDITYKWIKISERMMSKEDIRRTVAKAFEAWSRVTPLNFRETTGEADINLSFVAKGDPVECANGSSPGGMLAHAFYRNTDNGDEIGNIHFDDAEPWGPRHRTSIFSRISLLNVATHEIGHTLGLAHSDDTGAVMFAHYSGNRKLTDDDIKAIQRIYGSRQDSSLVLSELNCDMRFDAIAHGAQGDIFVYAGEYFYLITPGGLARKRKIKEWFPGAPDSPDAVVYDRFSGRLYFFKDKYVYRFMAYELSEGYPQQIPEDFWNPDAAIMRFDKEFYLFKDGRVSRWVDWERVTSQFQSIKSFYDSDAPVKVDAAFEYNSQTTFLFSGDKYWRYDVINQHEQLAPGYPKSIKPFWLHCGFVPGRDDEPIFGYVG